LRNDRFGQKPSVENEAIWLSASEAVSEHAVYDRSQTSHAVNFFDMASKYADAMPTVNLVHVLCSALNRA
jgi:hypothetical protein